MLIDYHPLIESKPIEELQSDYVNGDNFQQEYIDVVEEELQKRGVDISGLAIRRKHKQDYLEEQYSKGKPGNPTLIIICFIAALLGGLLSIIAGVVYSQSKHRYIGDGSYYVYDEKTRTLGKIMIVIGVFVTLLIIVGRFTS